MTLLSDAAQKRVDEWLPEPFVMATKNEKSWKEAKADCEGIDTLEGKLYTEKEILHFFSS